MLDRDTEEPILGIYKQNSDGILKFTYVATAEKTTGAKCNLKLHSFPVDYNTTGICAIIHAAKRNVISTSYEKTIDNTTYSLNMQHYIADEALPIIQGLTEYDSDNNAAYISRLNSPIVYYSFLFKYSHTLDLELSSTKRIIVLNGNNASTQDSWFTSRIEFNDNSSLLQLGDNYYVLNVVQRYFTPNSDEKYNLPYLSLVDVTYNNGYHYVSDDKFVLHDAALIAYAQI